MNEIKFDKAVNESDLFSDNQSHINLNGLTNKNLNLNLSEKINNINYLITVKKKNPTLQYYKFLLYFLKTEIKINEFFEIIKLSSICELALFIICILFMVSGEIFFSFLCQGFLHFIRSCLGFYLLEKLPKTYNLIDKINLDDKILETKIFVDILRDAIKEEVLKSFEKEKIYMVAYFSLNFFNYIIDIIGFIICLFYLGDVQDIIDGAICIRNSSSYLNQSNSTYEETHISLEDQNTRIVLYYIILFIACTIYLSN